MSNPCLQTHSCNGLTHQWVASFPFLHLCTPGYCDLHGHRNSTQKIRILWGKPLLLPFVSVIHNLPPPPKKERKNPNQMLIPLLCPLSVFRSESIFSAIACYRRKVAPCLPTLRFQPNSTQAFWKLRLWMLISYGAVQWSLCTVFMNSTERAL